MVTLSYTAPEVIDGPPTPATDVWSFGIMLYEMVTGKVIHPCLIALCPLFLIALRPSSAPPPLPSTQRPFTGITPFDVHDSTPPRPLILAPPPPLRSAPLCWNALGCPPCRTDEQDAAGGVAS